MHIGNGRVRFSGRHRKRGKRLIGSVVPIACPEPVEGSRTPRDMGHPLPSGASDMGHPARWSPVQLCNFGGADSNPMQMGRSAGAYDVLRIYPSTLVEVMSDIKGREIIPALAI